PPDDLVPSHEPDVAPAWASTDDALAEETADITATPQASGAPTPPEPTSAASPDVASALPDIADAEAAAEPHRLIEAEPAPPAEPELAALAEPPPPVGADVGADFAAGLGSGVDTDASADASAEVDATTEQAAFAPVSPPAESEDGTAS